METEMCDLISYSEWNSGVLTPTLKQQGPPVVITNQIP